MSNESTNSGAIPMVKIDGEMVRKLRESKGLTQLYLATAVDVTTDTISRWENRRYPTIKKENGVKLATALEVELVDILEKEQIKEIEPDQEQPALDQISNVQHKKTGKYILLLVFTVFLIMGLASLWFMPSREGGFLAAYRMLPTRSVAGEPIPVVLEISCEEGKTQSVIVKESLPEGAVVVQSSPPVTTVNKQGRELKWLHKIAGHTRFTYLVKLQAGTGKIADFSGSVEVAQGQVVAVQGDHQILIDSSHWADRDGDQVISDTEILSVYDQFGDIEGLDVDFIEKMWAGSGYSWNSAKRVFEVVE